MTVIAKVGCPGGSACARQFRRAVKETVGTRLAGGGRGKRIPAAASRGHRRQGRTVGDAIHWFVLAVVVAAAPASRRSGLATVIPRRRRIQRVNTGRSRQFALALRLALTLAFRFALALVLRLALALALRRLALARCLALRRLALARCLALSLHLGRAMVRGQQSTPDEVRWTASRRPMVARLARPSWKVCTRIAPLANGRVGGGRHGLTRRFLGRRCAASASTPTPTPIASIATIASIASIVAAPGPAAVFAARQRLEETGGGARA